MVCICRKTSKTNHTLYEIDSVYKNIIIETDKTNCRITRIFSKSFLIFLKMDILKCPKMKSSKNFMEKFVKNRV